jgi:hypothetical protein
MSRPDIAGRNGADRQGSRTALASTTSPQTSRVVRMVVAATGRDAGPSFVSVCTDGSRTRRCGRTVALAACRLPVMAGWVRRSPSSG